MTETASAPTGPFDTIAFSNVTAVRDQQGEMSVWVGNEKIMGAANISISNGVLVLAVPLSRVRLSEDVPATQVRQTKGNVVFGRFTPKDLGTDGLPDGGDA